MLGVMSACASYFRLNESFNKAFANGDLEAALHLAEKHDAGWERTRFLSYVNAGLILSMMGRYEDSNVQFEKAFLFGEDYRVNYVTEAASYFTNPTITVYRGEDHEHLLLLYYKALNYLKMGDKDDALVECRRLNIRLDQLNDRYNGENKYQRDAFIHTLMGIIYEANDDYNNAFIAYRNAYNIYKDDYSQLFQTPVPEQLKKDLLNTAWWTGFQDEFDYYKKEFGMEDYKPDMPEAELVFFWQNGLCPVKEEWSINFAVTEPGDKTVVFANDAMHLSFSFPLENDDDRDQLKSLQIFRVAFPKYVERPVYYTAASLSKDGTDYPLELTEDVNKIAFHSLDERMALELSKGLLRAALKKAAEMGVRKKDETLGAVLGVVNALTEKADTRNWQTLPHSINYARIPLREGRNEVTFERRTSDGTVAVDHFVYHAEKGETLFHTYTSLESLPQTPLYY